MAGKVLNFCHSCTNKDLESTGFGFNPGQDCGGISPKKKKKLAEWAKSVHSAESWPTEHLLGLHIVLNKVLTDIFLGATLDLATMNVISTSPCWSSVQR